MKVSIVIPTFNRKPILEKCLFALEKQKLNKIVEDYTIVDTCKNFDCFDLARTIKYFQKKVYGIKVSINNESEKKTIIISGIVDDILTECTNHSYILNKLIELKNNKPDDPSFTFSDYERYVNSLTIKTQQSTKIAPKQATCLSIHM